MRRSGHLKVYTAVATALLCYMLLYSIPVQELLAQEATTGSQLLRYPGTSLGGLTSAETPKSLDDCRKLCIERQGCVGFEHQTSTNQCRLFAAIGSAHPDSASNAETRNPIAGYRPPTRGQVSHEALRSEVPSSVTGAGKTRQPSNILEIDDSSAKLLLRAMSSNGDLKTPQHSDAWIVVSTVALGMGLEKCGFAKPRDGSFFWKPALESMTPDQIMVLNRMVTANFRDAQTDKFVNLKQLFPITRQAVIFLSDGKAKWNCEEIAGVWQAATNYSARKDTK